MTLTRRQLEVLRLLAEGVQHKDIAWRLGCVTATVDKHAAGVMRGLGARNIAHAVAIAFRRGILS